MKILENTFDIQNENKRIGSNFLGILNDLKRRPEDAARELDVSIEEINLIVEGKKKLSSELIERAAKILKSQKEHLPKTIARFIKEVDELSGKLKQILPKLKTQPVDEAVTELFTTWKRLRKELKKRRRNS